MCVSVTKMKENHAWWLNKEGAGTSSTSARRCLNVIKVTNLFPGAFESLLDLSNWRLQDLAEVQRFMQQRSKLLHPRDYLINT